jgi:hypothetical protein
VAGRKVAKENDMEVDGANVDITNVVPDLLGVRPLEERKLDYIHLEHGVQPRSQSSVSPFSVSLRSCSLNLAGFLHDRSINLFLNSSHAHEHEMTHPTVKSSCTLSRRRNANSKPSMATAPLRWKFHHAPALMQNLLIGTSR